jgi:hypothetical protein
MTTAGPHRSAPANHRATYLNDHLAGSVVAIEMLEALEERATSQEQHNAISRLRADIVADQEQLRSLMRRLDVSESATRKAAAWLGEKVSRVKLILDDHADGALRQLEAWETIALGIDGKRALWAALDAVSLSDGDLAGMDYRHLMERAVEQRARAESLRIEAAHRALVPG